MRASTAVAAAFLLLLRLCECALSSAPAVAFPDLPLGDINVIAVTDVHSFIGGHRHEPYRNADYGDVLSFYEQLKHMCDEKGSDLWFVMNGDWIHGTGLAMDGNATHLVPLLNQMPWDALTMGNHEAYHNAVVESMRDVMLPHFGDKFITSNILSSDTMKPFGSQYQMLKGANNTVLVFGFVYNMHEPSELLTQTKVEKAVQEEWFQTAVKEETYDAVMILAHMDVDARFLQTILDPIRALMGDDMPVQFITGHTHIRAQSKLDPWSHSFQAGANLDTVGFVSFPTQKTAQLVSSKKVAKKLFRYEFLNASKAVLKNTLGVEKLQTDNGANLSKAIRSTQKALGLNEVVGCPPKNYFRDHSIHAHDSLWKLWRDRVIPTQIFKRKTDCAMIVSKNSWRYDIVGSSKPSDRMTLDDVVAIAPFMEPVIYVGKVPEWAILRMNSSLNTMSLMAHNEIPDYILVGEFDAYDSGNEIYDLYTQQFSLAEVLKDLKRFNVKGLNVRRTGDRDTLYWLNFIKEAWACDGKPNTVVPWFQNNAELDEEATDGERSSGSLDEDFDEDWETGETAKPEDNKKDENLEKLHYEGYEGYLPPSTANQYKDVLPPGAAPTTVHKPKPTSPTSKKAVKHSAAAHKGERAEQRKKTKKIVFKSFAILIAVVLLVTPLVCLFMTASGRNRSDSDDVIFYDQEELKSLKRAGRRQERQRARPGGRPVGRSKPKPKEAPEIEITWFGEKLT